MAVVVGIVMQSMMAGIDPALRSGTRMTESKSSPPSTRTHRITTRRSASAVAIRWRASTGALSEWLCQVLVRFGQQAWQGTG